MGGAGNIIYIPVGKLCCNSITCRVVSLRKKMPVNRIQPYGSKVPHTHTHTLNHRHFLMLRTEPHMLLTDVTTGKSLEGFVSVQAVLVSVLVLKLETLNPEESLFQFRWC